MRKTFTSYSNNREKNDESVVIELILVSEGDELFLSLTKEVAEAKFGRDPTVISEESLEVSIDPQQLAMISNTLDDWLDSQSKSTFFESLGDIEGEYTYSSRSKSGDFLPTRSADLDNAPLRFSVGEHTVKFYWETDSEQENIEIPSAESIKNGIPNDFENILLLNQVINDFFRYRYPGDTTGLGLDLESKSGYNRDDVEKIERIFNRFGKIVNQLKTRDRGKSPLLMNNEYDVQYLLHALLRLYFDDVRDESYLEQHATTSPRIDFLLKDAEIGIEVKVASDPNSAKRIQSGLAEDKELYRSDSNVSTLLCFIYDQDTHIKNPAEIEKDLSEVRENLVTRVVVTQ